MSSEPAEHPETPANERRVLVLPTTTADAEAMGKLFNANRIDSSMCSDMAQLVRPAS